MKVIAPPGVFRPRSDTWMLARVLGDQDLPRDARVLDLCTGSGALAVAAAQAGAGEVVAVDVSRRAVLTAALNARRNRVRVDVRRGDLFAAVAGECFDAIVSNPPYLPASSQRLPRRGPARAWDAGRDGRALIDRICDGAPAHLRPGGILLLMQSSMCGLDLTERRLGVAGLGVDVADRAVGPLGPLLAARAGMLERRGLLPGGRAEEELLVVRARRPQAMAPAAGAAPSLA